MHVILKYLGEEGGNVPHFVDRAITFSVPCDIPSTNIEMKKWYNQIYLKRFLSTLNEKLEIKSNQFPNQLQFSGKKLKTFHDFDNFYTAPVHGYKDAEDYWNSCSSKHFLANIQLTAYHFLFYHIVVVLSNKYHNRLQHHDLYTRNTIKVHNTAS